MKREALISGYLVQLHHNLDAMSGSESLLVIRTSLALYLRKQHHSKLLILLGRVSPTESAVFLNTTLSKSAVLTNTALS